MVVVSTVVTLTLCECGTRLWLATVATNQHITRYGTVAQVESMPRRYERHHYLPFIPAPSYERGKNRHNALGFRGDDIEVPKPDGVFRIAMLGGSTTYTVDVDDFRSSYPYRLQQVLRRRRPSIEVVNAGCPMYSTWESLMNLQFRVLDLEPDLVVVYHGINDVHPRVVSPSSAYVGDNSGGRQPYDRREESFLWEGSALARLVATNLGLRDASSGQLFLRTFHNVPTNHAVAFREQMLAETYPSGEFEERSIQEMLAANDPRYFRRNLLNMTAIAKIHGAPTVLMTFAWSPHFPDRPRVSSQEYQEAYREQNAIVLELCRTHDAHCFDLANEMPSDRELWTDGRHVNERGAELKATLVARHLESSGLLPNSDP